MTEIHTSKKISAANGAGKSCRLLGLPGDAQTKFAFPHANNACYAVDPACPVRSEHQISHCLSAAHQNCRLYRSYNGLEGGYKSVSGSELKAILNIVSPRRTWLWSIVVLVTALALIAAALVFSGNILASLASGGQDRELLIERADALYLPSVHGPSKAADAPAPQSTATATLPPNTPGSEATDSAPAPTATLEQLATAVVYSCGPPNGWVLYTVRSGDSLYRLSLATGASIDQLRLANCLVVGGLIYAGQSLYLPRLPVPTAAPSNTPTVPPDPTELPAVTETEVPTATETEQPPTATQPAPTATTTELPAPTASEAPPTATQPAPTATTTTTEMPVPTATDTEPPPTAAPPTDTPPAPSPAPTETALPELPTLTPSDTAPPTSTLAPTPTPLSSSPGP